MSNNKEQILQKKLEFLYNKLEKITENHNQKQVDFLIQEIDYYQTEVLKLETYQYYKEIDNDQDN
jgi:hypothetical protein